MSNDLNPNLQNESSETSTPKVQAILGTLLLTDSWTMYAEDEEKDLMLSCVTMIGRILASTLNKCDSSLVVGTSTTLDDPTKPTITVTFSVQKKTQEKNGQQ